MNKKERNNFMRFNINDYEGKYVMHCKTEEEAEVFCRYLDSVGRKWCNGISYLQENEWIIYTDQTCYAFNQSMYGSVFFLTDRNYTILEFSDFEWDDSNVTTATTREKIKKINNLTSQWLAAVETYGNECASADGVVENIIAACNELQEKTRK